MVDSDLNTYGEAAAILLVLLLLVKRLRSKLKILLQKQLSHSVVTNTSFSFVNGGTWSVSGGSASGNQWTLNANSTETGTFTVPSNYVGTGRIYFSGNNTHFRVYDISPASDTAATQDISVDSPVNGNEASTGAGGERRGNYATLSPLLNTVATLSNGALLYTAHGSTQHCVGSTIAVSSGKYYWEYTIETAGTYHYAGIADIDTPFTTNWCGSNSGWSIGINGAGNISWNNAENHGGIGISASSGQTWGWALDMDAGTLHVYVNVARFLEPIVHRYIIERS